MTKTSVHLNLDDLIQCTRKLKHSWFKDICYRIENGYINQVGDFCIKFKITSSDHHLASYIFVDELHEFFHFALATGKPKTLNMILDHWQVPHDCSLKERLALFQLKV